MTREKFTTIKFTAYMPIIHIQPRSKKETLCMLMAIDFDEDLLTLEPFDKVEYKDEKFIARCENCFIPTHKLTLK
jgi:hypothetical protein